MQWSANQQHAIIEAIQDTVVVLKGRGSIENVNADSTMEIHGYSLQPGASIPFESPPWSAWATVPVTAGTRLKISNYSCSYRYSDGSFTVYAATDGEARPTVIPWPWQNAADAIVNDYTGIQKSEREEQAKQPVYAHATFFRPTVGDSDEDDETNMKHENATSESPAPRRFDRTNGFQVVVAGAKGVGKSTCLRYCLNRLLNITDKVAVLDADPGQPEYCVPGQLQLSVVTTPSLVPPYCHLQTAKAAQHTIIQSHYFGSVTSSSDPITYLQCIAALLTAYKEQLSDKNDCMPLLVNLDGWIKELGYDILTAVLQDTLHPNHAIQIAGDSLSKALDLSNVVIADTRLHACWAYNSRHNHTIGNGNGNQQQLLHETPQQQQRLLSRSSSLASYENGDATDEPPPQPTVIVPSTPSIPATALRSVRLVTYFLDPAVVEDGKASATIWDRVSVGWQGIDDPACEIADLLAAARPYAVSMDAVTVRFTSSDLHRDIRSEDRVWDAVNGSIVGLCSDEQCGGDYSAQDSAALLPCMGLGLVRAIDRVNRLIFVLTPCSSLESVNVLTVGSNVHLPLECYFRGVHSESFPYISFDAVTNRELDILGADPMKSRNNISRRGQGGAN
jgi:polynucleotide 5'-hydroxyl-kinase GRC3/NOL9